MLLFLFLFFGLSPWRPIILLRASSLMATYITHRSQLSTFLGENVKSFSSLICAGPSLLEFIPAVLSAAMELRYELAMTVSCRLLFEGIMAAMNVLGLQRSSHLCYPFPLEHCL